MTWYSTGTVKTTANNAIVTGTGTAWNNSGLRPGDMMLIGYNTISPRGFEIKSIDSATQITLVLPFPVAVNGGAYVGIPMLSGDRTAITMTLATQVSKAFADNQAMQAVWQSFYSGAGTVTLTMPDGTQITGSSFLKLTADMAGKANTEDVNKKANKGENSDITALTGLTTALSVKQGGTGAKSASDARSNIGAYSSAGGEISGPATFNAAALASFNGGALFDLNKGFTLKGAVQGGDNATNNIAIVTGAGNSGSYVGYMLYQWYRDGWITGIQRGGSTNSLAYSIFYNGSSAGGVSKTWSFNTDGSASGAGPWVNASDKRHKSKIKAVETPLSAVCSWLGCSYDLKDGGRSVGLIAQDVEVWCPEAVKTYGAREFSDKSVVEDFKYLDATGVAAAYHTEAIKQLFSLIELALDDPDACRAQVKAVKAAMLEGTQSEQTE